MEEPMNRRKSMKNKCLKRSGNRIKEVTLCHLPDCPLWPKDYHEVLNLITEYAQNVPFLLQYVQIDAVQQKRESHEGKTIQTEIRA